VNIGVANRFRIVVVLAALAALSACSTTPRNSAERAADAQLAAQVLAAVRADDAIYSPHIDVEVELGEVHLKGFVYTDAERQLAESDAGSVPGVRAVVMEIGLMGGGISENSN
jgi:osmotically-inducible protein OsmY